MYNINAVDSCVLYPMNKIRFQDMKHTNTYKLSTLGTTD